jgi:hypothetical protein
MSQSLSRAKADMKILLLFVTCCCGFLAACSRNRLQERPKSFQRQGAGQRPSSRVKPTAKRPRDILMSHLKSGLIGKNRVSTRGYGIYATGSPPLRIVDQEYLIGLYCPSEGEVVVHRPAPGKSHDLWTGETRTQGSQVGFAKSSVCDRQPFVNQVCKSRTSSRVPEKTRDRMPAVTQCRFLRTGFQGNYREIWAISSVFVGDSVKFLCRRD